MGLPRREFCTSALHQHLVSVVTSSNQFGPVQYAWQIDSIRNSVAYCITSSSDFDKGGCVIQIEWTKALCDSYYPCPKLLCSEVSEVNQISMKQTLVFRTWIVRWCNPVWVHKLADIITSLLLSIHSVYISKWSSRWADSKSGLSFIIQWSICA